MVNLYHLQYFCHAYKTQSLTRAAELSHVSVPTISHAIKSLESSLGYDLVVHKKNSLEFTNEADQLYSRANDLLQNAQDLKLTSSASSSVRIAASNSMFEHFLVPHYSRQFSEFQRVELKIANSRRMKQLFVNKEIDFGIAIPDRHLIDIPMDELLRGRFVMAEAKDSKNDSLYFIGDQGEEVDMFLEKYKKLHKKLPAQVCVVESWSGALKLIKQGHGRGMVPDFMVKNDKSLRIVDTEIKLPEYRVGIFHQGTRHDELKKKLIQSLKK